MLLMLQITMSTVEAEVSKGHFFQKVICIFQIVQKMCQENYPEQEIWQFMDKSFVIFVYREFP